MDHRISSDLEFTIAQARDTHLETVKEATNDQRPLLEIQKDFDAGRRRCPVRLLRFVKYDEDLLERFLHPEKLPPADKRYRATSLKSASKGEKRRKVMKANGAVSAAHGEFASDQDGDELLSDLSDPDD